MNEPWRIHSSYPRDVVPFWRRHAIMYPRHWVNRPMNNWNWELERQCLDLERRMRMDLVTSTTSRDGFEVTLDVIQYAPHEIFVKTNDWEVTVEAKHEEHFGQRSHVKREFTRRYILPAEYDPNEITSELSSDGFLTIRAPPKRPLPKNHYVNIHHTGSVRGNTKAISN